MSKSAIRQIHSKARSAYQFYRYAVAHGKIASVIHNVKQEKLTYLNRGALVDLAKVIKATDKQAEPGALVEAGCALGGSALVMSGAKSTSTPFYIYDVFDMIPPPSDADGSDVIERFENIKQGTAQGIDGDTYYGYQDDLYQTVQDTFRRYGFDNARDSLHFIKGLYEDTLHIDFPVQVAHIDCDWFASVMTCLERIEPHLVTNGVIVIDDYEEWSGARKAVETYFEDKDRTRYEFIYRNRLHIVKH